VSRLALRVLRGGLTDVVNRYTARVEGGRHRLDKDLPCQGERERDTDDVRNRSSKETLAAVKKPHSV